MMTGMEVAEVGMMKEMVDGTVVMEGDMVTEVTGTKVEVGVGVPPDLAEVTILVLEEEEVMMIDVEVMISGEMVHQEGRCNDSHFAFW